MAETVVIVRQAEADSGWQDAAVICRLVFNHLPYHGTVRAMIKELAAATQTQLRWNFEDSPQGHYIDPA